MWRWLCLILFLISMCYVNELVDLIHSKMSYNRNIVPDQYKKYMKSQTKASNLEEYRATKDGTIEESY